MGRATLSAKVFGGLGLAIIVAGVVLAALGSFAYVGVLSVGLFFTAAGLLARAAPSPKSRVAAILAVVSACLLTFGMVATPLFYAGWGLLAGSAALAVLASRRRPPS